MKAVASTGPIAGIRSKPASAKPLITAIGVCEATAAYCGG